MQKKSGCSYRSEPGLCEIVLPHRRVGAGRHVWRKRADRINGAD